MTTKPMPSLADVVTSPAERLPNRIIIQAVEGWGKTSMGAQFPAPIFIQTGQETGLETLISNNQLPETPHFPAVQSWNELNMRMDQVLKLKHDHKTLAIDVFSNPGAEALLFEHVRDTHCGGDADKFAAFGRGYLLGFPYWKEFLARLHQIRVERGMTIVLLGHVTVSKWKNPGGTDYSRFTADLHRDNWGQAYRWADICLFGDFETVVAGGNDGLDGKPAIAGKGIGGAVRRLYTTRTSSYDAKNRHGLPSEIACGNSAAEAFANFKSALVQGRK